MFFPGQLELQNKAGHKMPQFGAAKVQGLFPQRPRVTDLTNRKTLHHFLNNDFISMSPINYKSSCLMVGGSCI